MALTEPQPKAAEINYSPCAMIDRHNRCRQDDLMLEKKLGTMDWSMRVNMSILGMIIVDTWLAFDGCTRAELNGRVKQTKFYELLTKELIDNSFDQVRTRDRRANEPNNDDPHQLLLSPIHVTPTKRKRHNKATGLETALAFQGRCQDCHEKWTLVCSECNRLGIHGTNNKETYMCKKCFPAHLLEVHSIE
jgi:hypothetical protein